MSDSPTYHEYWSQVESIAKDVTTEAREQDRDITEVLWEWIDGHEYIIYYSKSHAVMRHTSNEDAYQDNFGVEGFAGKGYDQIATLYAYGAMEADVMNHSAFDADPDEE